MGKKRLLAMGFCVLAVSLVLAGSLFAAGQVTINGTMDQAARNMTTEDGQTYMVNASDDMSSDISKLRGKKVEMTGVVKDKGGRKFFTVLSYKVLD